jgi:hypothetical protein
VREGRVGSMPASSRPRPARSGTSLSASATASPPDDNHHHRRRAG